MSNTQSKAKGGRCLVLIDIENLAGTPNPTTREVVRVMDALHDALPIPDRAHCVVACSHHAAKAVSFAIPSVRHLWRSGRDGADLALLSVLNDERVEERFEYVIVCSGDGIFAARVAQLALSNVNVTVASLRGYLSARLELAARRIVLLELPSDIASAGAVS